MTWYDRSYYNTPPSNVSEVLDLFTICHATEESHRVWWQHAEVFASRTVRTG